MTIDMKEELISIVLNTRNFCGSEHQAIKEFARENHINISEEERFEVMTAVDFRWFDDCSLQNVSSYQEVFR